MATVQIEIGDAGIDFSKLPDEVRPHFQREFDRAFAKGAVAKATELKEADALTSPEERAELRRLRDEQKQRELTDAEKAKEYEQAKAKLAENYQSELAKRDGEISRRDARIRQGLKSEVRAAAVAAGARHDSLDELEALLSTRLDLDADFNTIVKDADGKPAVKDGKPMTVDQLVSGYLDSKPHHRKPAGGGGGASGGRSTTGSGGVATKFDGALDRVKEAPSATAIGAALAAAGSR